MTQIVQQKNTSPIDFGESSTTMGWIWKQVNKNISEPAIKRPWVDVWSWLLRVQQNGDDNWNKKCLKHTKLTSQLVLLVVGLRLSSLVLKLYVLTFLNNGMVMSVWDNPFHNTKKLVESSVSVSRASRSHHLPVGLTLHRGTETTWQQHLLKLKWEVGLQAAAGYWIRNQFIYTSMSSSTAMPFFLWLNDHMFNLHVALKSPFKWLLLKQPPQIVATQNLRIMRLSQTAQGSNE